MIGNETLSASLEDYIETIYLIGSENNSVRPKEIIARLGVTGPSVTEALHLLKEKGLILYAPYGPVTLTKQGEEIARGVYYRHLTLKRFFIEVLGLDEDLAEEGACRMEHSASADLIHRVVVYTRFAKEDCCENQQSCVAQRFKAYLLQQEEQQAHADEDTIMRHDGSGEAG